MKVLRLALLAPLALGPAALAPRAGLAHSQASLADPRAPAEAELSPLERAFAALDERGLVADLEFLCDPVLAGRGTATREGELAARYVEARVRRLGLEPGSTEGYLPRFPLLRRRLALEASGSELIHAGRTFPLRLGRDLFLRSTGDLIDADVRGPLVGIGRGSRRELETAGDLRGAWALLIDDGRGTVGAARRAFDAGALGVAITPGTDYAREPYAERFGPATDQLVEGFLASPLSAPPADRVAQPVLMLPRSTAAEVAAALGTDVVSLSEPGHRAGLELAERRTVEAVEERSPNVAALLGGADPERASELIVLCAHLDHLGVRDGEVYPGADDNASGSVGLLALAEALVARGPLDRSVLFLWVTGEEAGLWGSAAWCDDPRLPAGLEPVAALNLDMIGRDDPRELWLTPTAAHPEHNALAGLVPELAPLEGFTDLVSQDEYWAASDHYSFATRLRIPVVYLSSGEHEQYHRPTDTPDLIDVDKLVRILRLHLRLLEASSGLELGSSD